jgi:hypothetical protein
MNITILGKDLKVVIYPTAGAFEPDLDKFYNELALNSQVIEVGNIRWSLSAHTDFDNPYRVVVRIRSIGSVFSEFNNYGLEFMTDLEDLRFTKIDSSYIDKMIVRYFKDSPDLQKQFDEYVKQLYSIEG